MTYQAVAEIVWSGPSRRERGAMVAKHALDRYRWYAYQLSIDWPHSAFAHSDSLAADALSLAYDNAVSLHFSGRRPSFAVRAAGDCP